jgi:hypothetical protein
MKIIVVLLSILFVGAVAMPLFIAEAVAQQNPPGAKAKRARLPRVTKIVLAGHATARATETLR